MTTDADDQQAADDAEHRLALIEAELTKLKEELGLLRWRIEMADEDANG